MKSPYVGGKGKKLPFKSTHIRIPEDLKLRVEALVSTYKSLYESEEDPRSEKFLQRVESSIVDTVRKTEDASKLLMSLEEAKEEAKKQIRGKKSKYEMFANLLTGIYGVKILPDELR